MPENENTDVVHIRNQRRLIHGKRQAVAQIARTHNHDPHTSITVHKKLSASSSARMKHTQRATALSQTDKSLTNTDTHKHTKYMRT